MAYPYEGVLEQLARETRTQLAQLGEITAGSQAEFERGLYGVLHLRPNRRVARALQTQREILVVVVAFASLQQRTVKFAKERIISSVGRLDPGIVLVAHTDDSADASLREWGRELGLSVLPLLMNDSTKKDLDLFDRLSRQLFHSDPFDVAGPIRGEGQFFGRSDAADVARRLRSGQVKAYFGIRKVGKTSLINRVVDHFRADRASCCVMVDCQGDGISQMGAAQLLDAITGAIIEALADEDDPYRSVIPIKNNPSISEAMWSLQYALEQARRPVLLVIDEVDYITPASPTGSHWTSEFNTLFRALRTVYQETCRQSVDFSILVGGVSSKWFYVESIDGVENAALAFVPQEFLGPFHRAQTVKMVKTLGRSAGLDFADSAADYVGEVCADIPYWVRKAGSYVHTHLDLDDRPIKVNDQQVRALMEDFEESEGCALAENSLEHLFRVHPELWEVVLRTDSDEPLSRRERRLLGSLREYGLLDQANRIKPGLVRAGIEAVDEVARLRSADPSAERQESSDLGGTGDRSTLVELLSAVGSERNDLELRMRSAVVHVLRIAQGRTGQSPKEVLLSSIDTKRRAALQPLTIDDLMQQLYWLDYVRIVDKNWVHFDPYFGPQNEFAIHVGIVNDRPDSHAKSIDEADVAMYRRSIRALRRGTDKVLMG